jgi:DNA mismatch repair protein MutS2
VRKLDDERAALELARAAADEREAEARRASARLDAELEEAKARQKRMLSEEAGALMDRLRRAREELRSAQARLRTKKLDAQAVRDAERTIDRVAGELAIGGPLEGLVGRGDENPGDPVRASDLRKGERVWVVRLRAEAEVVDVLSDGNVRVAAGPLKLTVSSSELRARAASLPSRAEKKPRTAALRSSPDGASAPLQSRENTCDLRGLRVDDGLAMATSFLDRAVGGGLDVVFLLHGHGTGALRDAIRQELARSPYVARSRGGASEEGGEAVTVVWLS